jgi:hypothetical protein
MTNFEVLDTIEDRTIRNRALINAIKQNPRSLLLGCINRKASAILQISFVWDETPEGEDYWSNVKQDLIKKESQA